MRTNHLHAADLELLVFERPETCPSCGADAYEDGPRQRCGGDECPAQTMRTVLHWLKQRNIMHIGPETVDRLMAIDGPVVDIHSLYTVTREQMAAACGSFANADKIMAELEKSKDCSVAEVLGSIGIPKIGITEARKLCSACGISTLKQARMLDAAAAQSALGPTKGQKFHDGLQARRTLTRKLNRVLRVADGSAKAATDWTDKTFCITGDLSVPRPAFVKLVENAGGIYKSSVVKGLNFLITNDASTGTGKIRDAKEKGVAVIDEAEALKMMGG